jgi:short-subunit dehydrogenase
MPESPRMRVLVTGAAAGIGLAIARRLARDGIGLALADRDAAGLEHAANELAAHGIAVTIIPGDIADAGTVEATAEAAGAIDGLVNCAGIYPVTPLLELTAAEGRSSTSRRQPASWPARASPITRPQRPASISSRG